MVHVTPQPRIDLLAANAVSGDPRRRTEYCGTAWVRSLSGDQGHPQIDFPVSLLPADILALKPGQTTIPAIEKSFPVPDSLAYRTDRLDDLEVAATVSLSALTTLDTGGSVYAGRAQFAPDPQGRPVSWLWLSVVTSWWSMTAAVTYRIVVVADPGALA